MSMLKPSTTTNTMRNINISENKIKVPVAVELNPKFCRNPQISVFIICWIQQLLRLKPNQPKLYLWSMTNSSQKPMQSSSKLPRKALQIY